MHTFKMHIYLYVFSKYDWSYLFNYLVCYLLACFYYLKCTFSMRRYATKSKYKIIRKMLF